MNPVERLLIAATSLVVAMSIFGSPIAARAAYCDADNSPTECYCNNATSGTPAPYRCSSTVTCAVQHWVYNVPSKGYFNNCTGSGCTTDSYCCKYDVITGCAKNGTY